MSSADEIEEKILPDGIKIGLNFKSKDSTIELISDWCKETFHPLRKKVFVGSLDSGGSQPGRIQFICPHSIQQKSKAVGHRPSQRVLFTGCSSKINICQQKTGDWKITTVNLQHSGHIVSEESYGTYSHIKKLNEDDIAYAEELINDIHIRPRNLATSLSNKTGFTFTSKDTQNLINKIKSTIKDGDVLEKHLAEIQVNGGEVKWSKDLQSGLIDCLWIQTHTMKSDVARSRPNTWQQDTTFGTNREGLIIAVVKLIIEVHHHKKDIFCHSLDCGPLLLHFYCMLLLSNFL